MNDLPVKHGSRAEEIPMHAGKQEGVGRAYYPDGCLQEEVEVRDGKVIRQATYKPGERKVTQANTRGISL